MAEERKRAVKPVVRMQPEAGTEVGLAAPHSLHPAAHIDRRIAAVVALEPDRKDLDCNQSVLVDSHTADVVDTAEAVALAAAADNL